MPKYSICIPTYNRSDVVIKALESALNQEYKDFEVLPVDNHSNNNHQNVIENYVNGAANNNVTYIRNQSNLGMFGNWNKCIAYAKGQYVTILSDDDLLAPNFLTNIDCVVEEYPNCSYFVKKEEFQISESFVFPKNDGYLDALKVRYLDSNILRWFNGLGTPAGFVFPRSVGSSVEFIPDEYPSSDYGFYINISKAIDIYYLDEVLAYVGIGINDSLKLNTIYGFVEKDKLLRKNCGQNNLINAALEYFQLNNYLLSAGYKDKIYIFSVLVDSLYKLMRKLIFKWYCR
jgi:glycosyltransferase